GRRADFGRNVSTLCLRPSSPLSIWTSCACSNVAARRFGALAAVCPYPTIIPGGPTNSGRARRKACRSITRNVLRNPPAIEKRLIGSAGQSRLGFVRRSENGRGNIENCRRKEWKVEARAKRNRYQGKHDY